MTWRDKVLSGFITNENATKRWDLSAMYIDFHIITVKFIHGRPANMTGFVHGNAGDRKEFCHLQSLRTEVRTYPLPRSYPWPFRIDSNAPVITASQIGHTAVIWWPPARRTNWDTSQRAEPVARPLHQRFWTSRHESLALTRRLEAAVMCC